MKSIINIKTGAIPRMIPEFEHLIGQVEKDIKEKKNLSPSFFFYR